MNLFGDLALGSTGTTLGWGVLCAILPGLFLAAWTSLVLAITGHQRPGLRYGVAVASLLLVVVFPAAQFALLSRSVAADGPLPEATIQAFAHKLQAGPTPPAEISLPQRLQAAGGAMVPWLVLVWMFGTGTLSLRLAGGWLYLRRKIRKETREAPPELQAQVDSLRARMGVRRPVQILIGPSFRLPATIGWQRPVILIPPDLLSQLDAAQTESILAHELAHVRRADYALNAAQLFVEALFFWNPAVWLASRQVRAEREGCCDTEAVKANGDVVAYAQALVRLDEFRSPAHRLAVAMCGVGLLSRLRRLLEQRLDTGVRNRWAAAGILVAILVGSLVTGLGSVWVVAKQRKASQDFSGWRATFLTHQLLATLNGKTASLEPELGATLQAARDSRLLIALVAALRSPQAQAREEAAWALGLMGDSRAVAYLEPLRSDADPAVRSAAVEAITRLR